MARLFNFHLFCGLAVAAMLVAGPAVARSTLVRQTCSDYALSDAKTPAGVKSYLRANSAAVLRECLVEYPVAVTYSRFDLPRKSAMGFCQVTEWQFSGGRLRGDARSRVEGRAFRMPADAESYRASLIQLWSGSQVCPAAVSGTYSWIDGLTDEQGARVLRFVAKLLADRRELDRAFESVRSDWSKGDKEVIWAERANAHVAYAVRFPPQGWWAWITSMGQFDVSVRIHTGQGDFAWKIISDRQMKDLKIRDSARFVH